MARACFGYAATVTSENADRIASDELIDHMIESFAASTSPGSTGPAGTGDHDNAASVRQWILANREEGGQS